MVTVIGIVQEDVVAVAKHSINVATKRTVVILDFKFPFRQFSPRRLPVHELELFIGQRTVERTKLCDLVVAHMRQQPLEDTRDIK